MNIMLTAGLTIIGTLFSVVGIYNYLPLDLLQFRQPEPTLGSTITTIAGTDTLSSSRSVINTNFSNLNTDKFELSAWYATTSAPQITTLAGLTSASALVTIGTLTSGSLGSGFTTVATARGGTGSTTQQANKLFYGDGDSFEQGTNLHWDNTNSYLGISSSTPQRAISVGGAVVSAECNLTDGATITFNLATCNQGKVVLGGNRTFDFTNETQALGQTIRFVACQDGTGSRTLTWDSAIRWAGGSAPALTTTANKCDVIAGFTTIATGTPIILLDKILNF